jgi:hypothetical protein
MQMCGQRFRAYLQRGHTMQAAVQSFVERFNAIDQDLRSTKEAQVGQVDRHVGSG